MMNKIMNYGLFLNNELNLFDFKRKLGQNFVI